MRALLTTSLLFKNMLLSYFLYGETLSVTEQENPEEPYVGKTVAYTILSQSAKQESSPLGGKRPESHPCHNHVLHPEKTHFSQVMPLSSCLFDGCTQLRIKKSDL